MLKQNLMMMFFFARERLDFIKIQIGYKSVAGAVATDDDALATTKHHATMAAVL
jgi:hypothetical protein